MISKNIPGFTLIELLIVTAILGILSVIGIGNFMSSRLKAQDLAKKSDLQTIAKSLEAYVYDHRAYPLATNSKITCQDNTICDWGSPFTDGVTLYISKLPGDATSPQYFYESDGKTYTLYTNLLNSEDPNILAVPVTCGGTQTCNYKITSTNQ